MKKRLGILLLAAILLLSVCACGKTPVDPSSSPTPGDDSGISSDPSGNDVSDPTSNEESDPTSNEESDPSSNNTTSATKTDKSTSKTTSTTKKPTGGSSGGSVKVDVNIKEGTKGLEEGLNFGGKTFKYALGLPLTEAMKRQIAQFQIKFNCKIETEVLGFNEYVQQVITKKAGGNYYDILQLEGFRFPAAPIANICEPVENLITTADWYSASQKAKGGFDKDLSLNFRWNNHLYAVVGCAGEFSPQMNVMYYNKKLVKESGADDPRELYNKGKWDWDAYYELGKKINKYSKTTYLCTSVTLNSCRSWNDGFVVDVSNPAKPTANLTGANILNAYKFVQKCALGNGAVVDYNLPGGSDNTPTLFIKGQTATYVGFYFDLYMNHCIGKSVEESNAFGKKLSNLGMVPVPLGPDNKRGANPVGSWLYGIGVGAGSSDPRVAMAFAKFSTTFKSTVKYDYNWSAEDQAVIDKLTAGAKCWSNYAYSDGSNDVQTLIAKCSFKIANGEDVAQVLSTYNAQIQHCIDVMISQQ